MVTALVASGLLLGCSLSTFEENACSTNADCTAAFGFGYQCGSAGLCEEASGNARCTRSFPDDLLRNGERYPNTVVVGTIFRTSAIPREEAREQAARLAATQLAEEGLPNDLTLGMVFCDHSESSELDGLGEAEAATATASYLTDTLGAVAIIGPSSSSTTLEVFDQVKGNGALVISPSATSPLLEDRDVDGGAPTDDAPGRLWRTAPSDSAQGLIIAQDMQARSVQSVAVVSQTGAYGDGLAQVFLQEFGNSEDVTTTTFDGGSQLAEILVGLNGQQHDEILFVSSNPQDVGSFLDFAASNFESSGLFLTDSAASQDVLLAVDNQAAFERVRGTRPKPLTSGDFAYGTFQAAFDFEYGRSADQFSFTAQSYDAGWLTFYGIAWSLLQEGGITGTGIARGLRRVSDKTQPEEIDLIRSSWSGVLNKFETGQSIDVRGASSNLDYDPSTEEFVQGTAPIELWRIETSDTDPVIVSIEE